MREKYSKNKNKLKTNKLIYKIRFKNTNNKSIIY